MATVIGVRFKKAGKVYYFDPSEVWPKPGQYVVVETTRGVELGEVVTGAREVSDEQIIAPLKKVIRMASAEDVRRSEANERKEKEAYTICQEKIASHNLEMKLVSVEYTFEGSKIIFYFTANGRVDFRDLVKDLAGIFKMRIELRQIGVRDEAKMLGGLGACGRPICCDTFLGDFQPVSIKMAKEQNLSLNPTKISGQCGRLMCCLKYEQDYYESMTKKLPRVGKDIVTPDGVGVVTEINVLREKVRARIRTSDDMFDVREYPLEDVRKLTPEDRAAEMAAREERASRESARMAARKAREEQAAQPQAADKPQKKRYPHPKAPKNMNTDEYMMKYSDVPQNGSPAAENEAVAPVESAGDAPSAVNGENTPETIETSVPTAPIPADETPAVAPSEDAPAQDDLEK